MSEAGWIATIAIVATLISGFGGVLLGNWLQSKSAKRQREQQLEDERLEQARALLEQHLKPIEEYLSAVIMLGSQTLANLKEAIASGRAAEARQVVSKFSDVWVEKDSMVRPHLYVVGEEELFNKFKGFEEKVYQISIVLSNFYQEGLSKLEELAKGVELITQLDSIDKLAAEVYVCIKQLRLNI